MKIEFNQFRNQFKGEIILPEDPKYNDARKIYNGMINKHPKAILKCKEANDIIKAVNFARENNLEVSIKSGGAQWRRTRFGRRGAGNRSF